MAKYYGTVSTGVITTTESNQVIKFYDPKNPNSTIDISFVYVENVGSTPCYISFNNEWNEIEGYGTRHYLMGDYDGIGFDDMEVKQVVVHDSGSTVRIIGQF